jgi:hypothetical protein
MLVGLSVATIYTGVFWQLPVYHYTSSDGGFNEIEVPWKGRDFNVVEQSFQEYKESGHDNVILIRTTPKPWASPNLWWDNLSHPRWRLPFQSRRATKEAESGPGE